ncbi:MAG: hypothetical protein R3337_00175 [Gammaproteobacteria bacterium]|nr:hypothetical protein [Gammaproteobacteria bacterium]
MEHARFWTPSGIVAAPLPEDDALVVCSLVESRPSKSELQRRFWALSDRCRGTDPHLAAQVDHSALWRRLDAIADRIDASAPDALATDAHGLLTAAELRRWS